MTHDWTVKEEKFSNRLLTYHEAAERLGVENMRSFYNLINKGVLREAVVEIPGMRNKIRADILRRIIEENTRKPLEV